MIRYFADIHVHVTLKPFHQKPRKDIWCNFAENSCDDLGFILNTVGNIKEDIATYSQGNLEKALNDTKTALRTRLIFNSLYPVELNLYAPRKFFDFLTSLKREVALGSCISGFEPDYIRQYIEHRKDNGKIDYFEGMMGFDGLQNEYDYLVSQTAVPYAGKFSVAIAQDYEDYKQIMDNQPEKLVIINTIEGLHSLLQLSNYEELSKENEDVDNPESHLFKHLETTFSNRIKTMKQWGAGKHAPLFITFTHHFWNMMCGQAKSFEGITASLVVKQDEGMQRGFTAIGEKVLDMLLDRQNGRRILIDTKHMNATSRRDFYHILNKKYRNQSDIVPIIASHTAVSGIRTLPDSANITDDWADIEDTYFNTWSINLCDQDIQEIYFSRGLIGLLLYPHRLAGGIARDKIKPNEHDEETIEKTKVEFIKLFLANAFHIVRVCGHADAWDLISIGSDFDGLIGYFKGFDSISAYDTLANAMIAFLHNLEEDNYTGKTEHYPAFTKKTYEKLMYGLTPEEIVEKIAYRNVDLFLSRYFHDEYLLDTIVHDIIL